MPNSIRNILKSLVYKGHMTQEQMDKIVRNLKSEDAVEVVQCKDCKWRGDEEHCPIKESRQGYWFCADGERKDDE